MHQYAEFHRRMVLRAYHRYLLAERSLQIARSEARSYFPRPGSQKTLLLGDPDSRLRRMIKRRDRALTRLAMLRNALRQTQEGERSKQRIRLTILGPLH